MVRLTGRDIAGLIWCGEMHGVPYDLLASLLAVRDDRLRAITGRWRRADYAQTARLGPGPGVVLADPPRAGRRRPGPAPDPAVPGTARAPARRRRRRLSLESGPAWADGHAHWRFERKIRHAMGGRLPAGHIPDGEVSWPDVPGSPYPGEMWAIEAELTPKPLARTAAIMRGLLGRTTGYSPGSAPRRDPRYARPGPGRRHIR